MFLCKKHQEELLSTKGKAWLFPQSYGHCEACDGRYNTDCKDVPSGADWAWGESEDDKSARVAKEKRELYKALLLTKFNEYADEAEHQDGTDYWNNFTDEEGNDWFEDFLLYWNAVVNEDYRTHD